MSTFGKPISRHPTLFSHAGLETFAHELGYAIYRFVQGSRGSHGPRDFVEIPSITAENWVHVPEILQHLSHHYTYLKPEYLTSWKAYYAPKQPPPQPPLQAPLEMFSKIKYKRHPRHDLYNTLELLWKSTFDFIVHSASEEDLKSMDLGVVCRQILDEQTGIFTLFEGKGQSQNNSYLHWNMLENYDTSAYCYLL